MTPKARKNSKKMAPKNSHYEGGLTMVFHVTITNLYICSRQDTRIKTPVLQPSDSLVKLTLRPTVKRHNTSATGPWTSQLRL